MTKKPPTDLKTVLESEIKEWHFHIYFHQGNAEEHHAAMELRDAVLRLRRDGAFIAVPLFRVNTEPMGPHPVGSYEIWVPTETFASVFSYLCMNRGSLRCISTYYDVILVMRALDSEKTMKIDVHGSVRLILSILTNFPFEAKRYLFNIRVSVGYSSKVPFMNLEDRAALGANVERVLLKEKDAARAPIP
ncbi:hypothetical protein MSAN_00085900 [Mycena sanguinolenta]|uniref:Uncharacterized protein n=1 Tax=Mycena sanguinolenta TaxID=230812 RepID=A0A8H7DIJ2_9AGAR|nr:hypothetical protein MSAN_00085900 [Mycena sanguinolenta]